MAESEKPESKGREIPIKDAVELFSREGGGGRFLELVSQLAEYDAYIVEGPEEFVPMVGELAGITAYTPEGFKYMAGRFPQIKEPLEESKAKLRRAITKLQADEEEVGEDALERARKWGEAGHEAIVGIQLAKRASDRQSVTALYCPPILNYDEAIRVLQITGITEEPEA